MATAADGHPPFVFVVGCGRSGTTVLRSVLDAHSQLAVTHEARFVVPLSRRRARYERDGSFDVDAFVADLATDRGALSNLGFDDGDVRTALGAGPVADYSDAVRRVFAHYSARHGKRRYGDKMPAYVLRMPLLAALFPEARFVHIIRDGRDVALSAMAIQRRPIVTYASDWRHRVTAGRRAGRQLGPLRYHEVRYEELVTDPAPSIEAVCRFLGLPYEPAMLRFFERPDGTPAKVLANPRHARLAEPLSSGTRSWRTDMPRSDLERFEAVAGQLLSELGYERAAPRPQVSARAAAGWGRVRWHAERARARLPGIARRAVGAGRSGHAVRGGLP